MSDNQIRPYPLRLEPDLRKELETIAKKNSRSLNSEIAVRLEESLSNNESDLDKKIRNLIREELNKK